MFFANILLECWFTDYKTQFPFSLIYVAEKCFLNTSEIQSKC